MLKHLWLWYHTYGSAPFPLACEIFIKRSSTLCKATHTNTSCKESLSKGAQDFARRESQTRLPAELMLLGTLVTIQWKLCMAGPFLGGKWYPHDYKLAATGVTDSSYFIDRIMLNLKTYLSIRRSCLFEARIYKISFSLLLFGFTSYPFLCPRRSS